MRGWRRTTTAERRCQPRMPLSSAVPLRQDTGERWAIFSWRPRRRRKRRLLFPGRLVPRWKSPAWGLRYLLHYLRLVADPSSWLYIAVAGAISGYVATYFTFRFLPFRSYTEPLIIENLLAALGVHNLPGVRAAAGHAVGGRAAGRPWLRTWEPKSMVSRWDAHADAHAPPPLPGHEHQLRLS